MVKFGKQFRSDILEEYKKYLIMKIKFSEIKLNFYKDFMNNLRLNIPITHFLLKYRILGEICI